MKKFNPAAVRSPPAVFILYMAASGLAILAFRFIFPGEAVPIPYFARSWRIIRGLLDFLNLFPALTMSALVVPFGIAAAYEEEYSSFSPKFFQSIKGPVIIAISAAAVYGLLFFLVLPLVQDWEANTRSEGGLYRLARERAREHGKAGEWPEASRFIAVCERIWPDSPEMASLKNEAAIHLEEYRFEEEDERAAARAEAAEDNRGAGFSAFPGERQPIDAVEALSMGETAFGGERYYDAHWLATLAERIAKPGSPEAVDASRLASRAWNALQSLAPTARESRIYSVFRLKQSGYEAMISGDWIRAYYIFQELSDLSPEDPDVVKFFAQSQRGAQEIAFFIDEIELGMGESLTGAVFSLPAGKVNGGPGRGVLRFSGLSGFPDYAYGMGLEYMSFDGEGRPVSRLEAPYAKILPTRPGDRPRTVILMRALDRYDRNLRRDPVWTGAAAASAETRLLLDIGYEDFLLLSQVRRGIDKLRMGELFSAARTAGSGGYISEVFEAEMIYRLSIPLFFLPLAILSIVIGWRYRAKKRPRYLFIPMLPLLPPVFYGLVCLYRTVLNTLGVWAVISLGFSTALIICVAGLTVLFIISLIILAAQHG
jgi:hypothetical protein